MNTTDPTTSTQTTAESEGKPKLNLDVRVEERGACTRHVVVTVSAEDVARYRDHALDDLVETAFVPGFRPGRAPRQLVAARYRNELSGHVKSALLIDALDQMSKEHKLVAISEPRLELEDVVLSDEGPMTFEFDIEVRPEFQLPQWKGLRLKVPTYTVTDEDIDRWLREALFRYSTLVPASGPAQLDDLLSLRFRFRKDGELLREFDEVMVVLRSEILFRDARIDKADQLLVGKQVGDRVTTQATLSASLADEKYRGQTVEVEIELLEIKRQRLPELTPALLRELGDFASVEALRDAARQRLVEQFEYYRDESVAKQITEQLLADANWALPPDLLRQQTRREIERLESELQSRGFSREQIEAQANQLRFDAAARTAAALRRHFILERIAEEEGIDVSDESLERMIEVLAEARNESPRRLRARLEKRGGLDILRNQVIENTVLKLIRDHAQTEQVPFVWPAQPVWPVPLSVVPEVEIPEAKVAEAQPLRQPEVRG